MPCAAAALPLAFLGALAACVSLDGFPCESSAQCGSSGVCEPEGFCSFADPACPSERRFGDHAGSFSGECTVPIVSTTLRFGRKPESDVSAGHRDTILRQGDPGSNFGQATDLGCNANPGNSIVALYRFNLSMIPTTAIIEAASLELAASGGTATIGAFEIVERWDEMTATYDNRLTATPWTTPGCGPGSRSMMSAGSTQTAAAGATTIDLDPLVVGRWVADESDNQGVVIVCSQGSLVMLASQEAIDAQRPQLSVTFR